MLLPPRTECGRASASSGSARRGRRAGSNARALRRTPAASTRACGTDSRTARERVPRAVDVPVGRRADELAGRLQDADDLGEKRLLIGEVLDRLERHVRVGGPIGHWQSRGVGDREPHVLGIGRGRAFRTPASERSNAHTPSARAPGSGRTCRRRKRSRRPPSLDAFGDEQIPGEVLVPDPRRQVAGERDPLPHYAHGEVLRP